MKRDFNLSPEYVSFGSFFEFCGTTDLAGGLCPGFDLTGPMDSKAGKLARKRSPSVQFIRMFSSSPNQLKYEGICNLRDEVPLTSRHGLRDFGRDWRRLCSWVIVLIVVPQTHQKIHIGLIQHLSARNRFAFLLFIVLVPFIEKTVHAVNGRNVFFIHNGTILRSRLVGRRSLSQNTRRCKL